MFSWRAGIYILPGTEFFPPYLKYDVDLLPPIFLTWILISPVFPDAHLISPLYSSFPLLFHLFSLIFPLCSPLFSSFPFILLTNRPVFPPCFFLADFPPDSSHWVELIPLMGNQRGGGYARFVPNYCQTRESSRVLLVPPD